MSTEVLRRFRDGLSAGRFTLTRMAALTKIPLTTLSDMKAENWQEKVVTRLDDLEAALDEVEREGPLPAVESASDGRATTAA